MAWVWSLMFEVWSLKPLFFSLPRMKLSHLRLRFDKFSRSLCLRQVSHGAHYFRRVPNTRLHQIDDTKSCKKEKVTNFLFCRTAEAEAEGFVVVQFKNTPNNPRRRSGVVWWQMNDKWKSRSADMYMYLANDGKYQNSSRMWDVQILF